MPSRKGWLTPNTPISDNTLCRRVLIPDNLEFVGAVSGALLELTKPYNWEQFGTVTAEQAAAVMAAMYADFVASDCDAAACPPSFRMWIGGRLQVTFDGGQTWADAEQSGVLPPVPVRTEPTAVEKRCLAAANAVEVYHQTFLALLDQFHQNSDVLIGLGFLSTVVGLLFGAWVGVSLTVINALLNFTGQAFATAWAALEFLGENDFTVELQDAFICLLFENSTVQNDVVTFDFQAVSDNISTLPAPLAMQAWLFWILNTVGEQGLNQAGSTTSVENYDCRCGQWCYTFDASSSIPLSEWDVWIKGTWQGSYWQGVISVLGGSSYNNSAGIQWEFENPVTLTRIEVEVTLAQGGGFGPPVTYARDLTDGQVATFTNFEQVYGDNIVLVWNGERTLQHMAIWANSARAGTAAPLANSITRIHRVTLRGTGDNPFDEDNCT